LQIIVTIPYGLVDLRSGHPSFLETAMRKKYDVSPHERVEYSVMNIAMSGPQLINPLLQEVTVRPSQPMSCFGQPFNQHDTLILNFGG